MCINKSVLSPGKRCSLLFTVLSCRLQRRLCCSQEGLLQRAQTCVHQNRQTRVHQTRAQTCVHQNRQTCAHYTRTQTGVHYQNIDLCTLEHRPVYTRTQTCVHQTRTQTRVHQNIDRCSLLEHRPVCTRADRRTEAPQKTSPTSCGATSSSAPYQRGQDELVNK